MLVGWTILLFSIFSSRLIQKLAMLKQSHITLIDFPWDLNYKLIGHGEFLCFFPLPYCIFDLSELSCNIFYAASSCSWVDIANYKGTFLELVPEIVFFFFVYWIEESYFISASALWRFMPKAFLDVVILGFVLGFYIVL